MYANNRTIFRSLMFGALFASVVSFFMVRRNRRMRMVEMPIVGLRRGRRMLKTGARAALRGAKQGLRALVR